MIYATSYSSTQEIAGAIAKTVSERGIGLDNPALSDYKEKKWNMNKNEFEQYCRDFNESENKEAFFDKYYDENAVFEHPLKGTFRGKQAILDFWTEGHQGIHEVLKPITFLEDGDRRAVEVKIEWRCLEDTDYLGSREKGHVYYADCAGFFHLKNGKIIKAKMYLNEVPGSPGKNC